VGLLRLWANAVFDAQHETEFECRIQKEKKRKQKGNKKEKRPLAGQKKDRMVKRVVSLGNGSLENCARMVNKNVTFMNI